MLTANVIFSGRTLISARFVYHLWSFMTGKFIFLFGSQIGWVWVSTCRLLPCPKLSIVVERLTAEWTFLHTQTKYHGVDFCDWFDIASDLRGGLLNGSEPVKSIRAIEWEAWTPETRLSLFLIWLGFIRFSPSVYYTFVIRNRLGWQSNYK